MGALTRFKVSVKEVCCYATNKSFDSICLFYIKLYYSRFSMEMKCSFSLVLERLCSDHTKPVVALNNIIQQYDSTSTEPELLIYRGCFFDADINQHTICDVHYEQFWRRWQPFKYCSLNIACKKVEPMKEAVLVWNNASTYMKM